ncbi:MAG: TonB-dependent receptor, partial [Muribaculaceae bacterium]|nr:TonB-dependent receptor [Muribaculaceae bacterium]
IISKGRVGDHYEWLGGIFGFYKRGSFNVPVNFKQDGIDSLIISNIPSGPVKLGFRDNSLPLLSRFSTPVWGVALYHQSNYEIDDWSFSAGLRLDFERTAMSWRSMCNTGVIYTVPMGPRPITDEIPIQMDDLTNLHNSYLNLLPKVSVSHRLGNAGQAYVSVAKGYKAGGYNTQMLSDVLQQRLKMTMMDEFRKIMPTLPTINMAYNPADMITYKPESSWNYEVGANLWANDYDMKIDLTAFYIDCRNQQLTVFPEGQTTGRMMVNADTRSAGAECAVLWRPVSNLNLCASYGFTDARFISYKDNDGIINYKNKRVPYAPRNTVFASADYRINVRERLLDAVSVNVNMKGVGPICWDERNEVKQPFYAQLGASVRLEWSKGSLDFWGENLTGCNFITYYFVSIGNAFAQQGKPRRVGVTLRWNFQSK